MFIFGWCLGICVCFDLIFDIGYGEDDLGFVELFV